MKPAAVMRPHLTVKLRPPLRVLAVTTLVSNAAIWLLGPLSAHQAISSSGVWPVLVACRLSQLRPLRLTTALAA